jgi:hypothetical protein
LFQEEISCIGVGDVCDEIKNECERINNSIICESYDVRNMNEINKRTLECFWIENNNYTTTTLSLSSLSSSSSSSLSSSLLSSTDFIKSRCIMKVFILI